ncbi:DUF1934 domain-containing protein [Weissella viridescens]|uniref:DUF1934 domain-containing protein n=1 Tax=Weissella viridescens TaxID=1629 RepID=A0A3P2RKC1_WEIVI|nr:DUF1934 domain-containing protein [Weissella viridescens]RRG18112.1 DUF1934 domain-containing protein [Weissella viridescens]
MENKTFPVQLDLTSQIERETEIESYTVHETAEFTQTEKAQYLRYTETPDSENDVAIDPALPSESKVMLKLEPDGSIKMRRTGLLNSQLHFDMARTTTTNYRTPAGIIVLDVITEQIQVEQASDQASGHIHIVYALNEQETSLGNYQIDIHYHA